MRLFNGDYQIEEADKCKTCLFPSTCATINLMKLHSKDVAMWSDEEIRIMIYKCPCRDIK